MKTPRPPPPPLPLEEAALVALIRKVIAESVSAPSTRGPAGTPIYYGEE